MSAIQRYCFEQSFCLHETYCIFTYTLRMHTVHELGSAWNWIAAHRRYRQHQQSNRTSNHSLSYKITVQVETVLCIVQYRLCVYTTHIMLLKWFYLSSLTAQYTNTYLCQHNYHTYMIVWCATIVLFICFWFQVWFVDTLFTMHDRLTWHGSCWWICNELRVPSLCIVGPINPMHSQIRLWLLCVSRYVLARSVHGVCSCNAHARPTTVHNVRRFAWPQNSVFIGGNDREIMYIYFWWINLLLHICARARGRLGSTGEPITLAFTWHDTIFDLPMVNSARAARSRMSQKQRFTIYWRTYSNGTQCNIRHGLQKQHTTVLFIRFENYEYFKCHVNASHFG